MVRKLNVLIIEDDLEIGKWLKKSISKLNNIKSLIWHSNIENALIEISINNPDIIILDLKLPDGSGLDVLKTIKKRKIKSLIYVFSVNNELKNICLRLGADYFFDKTTDSDKLIEYVKEPDKK